MLDYEQSHFARTHKKYNQQDNRLVCSRNSSTISPLDKNRFNVFVVFQFVNILFSITAFANIFYTDLLTKKCRKLLARMKQKPYMKNYISNYHAKKILYLGKRFIFISFLLNNKSLFFCIFDYNL